jgi:hypothetical protein
MLRLNRPALALALVSCSVLPVFGAGDVGNFNFNETTGLINIPIARVAKAGTFKFFVQPTAINRVGVFGGADDSLFANDGTQKTIIGLGKGMELSLAMFTGVQKLDSFVLGFKWNAIEATEDTPGFSVGVQSIGAGVRPFNPHPPHFNGASVFGVASHSFKLNDDDMAIDLHAGIGTNRLRNGFGGIEFHFNDTWSLIGEHDGTIQSAGIRFKPHERIDIMPVLQFHSNNQVHAGFSLGYTFGGFNDEKPLAPPDKMEPVKSVPDQPAEEPASFKPALPLASQASEPSIKPAPTPASQASEPSSKPAPTPASQASETSVKPAPAQPSAPVAEPQAPSAPQQDDDEQPETMKPLPTP